MTGSLPAPSSLHGSTDTCVNTLLSLAFHLITCGWGFHLNILFSATPPIPLHALAALMAILIGGVQLCLSKGTPLHKLIGRIWVGLMAVVSLSSFFIYELKIWGNYSPIHLLSVWVLISLIGGIYFANIGKIEWHRWTMVSMYFLALILTGFFTLLPERIMNKVLFNLL